MFTCSKVRDVNDNAPVFSSLLYEARIREASGSGIFLVKVSATDIDTASAQPHSITFLLDNNGTKYFTINAESGVISTSAEPLDREKTPVFYFTVTADDGKNQGHAGVRVIVEDVNDKPPRFPNPPYYGYVEENEASGASVTVVQAIDEDDPSVDGNTRVTYTLEDDADGRFVIDKDSALIKNTQPFDRESKPAQFNVTVKATDNGEPQLSGTVNVVIYVVDTNDHKPKFNPKTYHATVSENAPFGHFVTSVSATDGDEGPNAAFEFSIIDGNTPYGFYIEPFNGKIYVSGVLDFEEKRTYKLTLNLTDRGMPLQVATEVAHVVIIIRDANDHPPVFAPTRYSRTIKEDVPAGTSLLTVTTTDVDIEPKTDLTFSITKGDTQDVFVVEVDPNDPKLGILKTFQLIDHETLKIYNLEVTAKDPDGFEAVCVIQVTITDSNDNGPHFIPAYYRGKIKENLDVNQLVTTVSAEDPDEATNGPPFNYTIMDGAENNNFRVDSSSATGKTAKIYSHGVFDREEKAEWKIWVQGVDSGTPQMSNITFVLVEVEDANDNEPFNGLLKIIVNAYEEKFAGGVIGKAYYKDEDYDGDVNEYKIKTQSQGDFFTVDSSSGDITARKDLPMGVYQIEVEIEEKNKREPDSNWPKVVTSNVEVVVRGVSALAIHNSLVIQFLSMSKLDYFVGDYYTRFEALLAQIFGVSEDSVLIFSIQVDSEALLAVDVYFAVQKTGQGFYNSMEAITKLSEQRNSLKGISKGFLSPCLIFYPGVKGYFTQ